MRNFARSAFSIGAAALFAGCGVQNGAAVPQGVTAQSRTPGAAASSGDLVYALTDKGIILLSYPNWGIVATIAGESTWYYVCSDPNTGNVFAVADGEIDEYAHGGTSPIATLTPPSRYRDFTGCAIDQTTGDLAVVMLHGPNNRGAVLVYPGATGTPSGYSNSKLADFSYPAYDGSGNLFVAAGTNNGGRRIAELKAGHTDFAIIKVDYTDYPQKIQWDGKNIFYQVSNGRDMGVTVNQVRISGKTGTIINSFVLNHCQNDYFWLYKGSLLSFYYPPKQRSDYAIAAWRFPIGGKPTSKFYGLTKGKRDYVHDLTVSVAPSRSRVRNEGDK